MGGLSRSFVSIVFWLNTNTHETFWSISCSWLLVIKRGLLGNSHGKWRFCRNINDQREFSSKPPKKSTGKFSDLKDKYLASWMKSFFLSFHVFDLYNYPINAIIINNFWEKSRHLHPFVLVTGRQLGPCVFLPDPMDGVIGVEFLSQTWRNGLQVLNTMFFTCCLSFASSKYHRNLDDDSKDLRNFQNFTRNGRFIFKSPGSQSQDPLSYSAGVKQGDIVEGEATIRKQPS